MSSEEAKHQVLEGFKNCELDILVVDERRKIVKDPDQRSGPTLLGKAPLASWWRTD